jgi:hypothetical protein
MKKIIAIAIVLTLGTTVEVANADFTFGEPVNLGPTVNTSGHEDGPAISADGLELYFESTRPGSFGSWDLWCTTRVSVDADWGEPRNLGSSVNSSDWDGFPCISADSLELYFISAARDFIGVMKRTTKSDDWGPVKVFGSTDNNFYYLFPMTISSDGLQMYFSSYGALPDSFGGSDLYMSTRPSVSDAWNEPQNLGPTVNSSANEDFLSISADGLMLFFESERPGGYGGPDNEDIWVSRRTRTEDPWGTPVNLGSIVNSPYDEGGPSISADGRTLYFHSYKRPGGYGGQDIYRASIDPVVDLNADGIIDSADMVIMVDNWGTDNSLCDIGPMPWGDGIVDVEDLIVLAEHLFEEIPPVE